MNYTFWLLVVLIVALAIHVILPAPPAHQANAIYDWWQSLWAPATPGGVTTL